MEYKLRTPKLLPTPKRALWGDGFLAWEKAEFQIDESGLPCGNFLDVHYSPHENSEHYRIAITADGIAVEAASEAGARAALQTLRQIGMQADSRGFRFCELEDSPDLSVRCFCLDLSDGRVPNAENMRLLADRLALFKYNRLELDLTDAYPFDGGEARWAGRAVLPPRAIDSLKKYCRALGVELSCRIDAAKVPLDAKLLGEISANFDCRDIAFAGVLRDSSEAERLSLACEKLGLNALFCDESFYVSGSGRKIFARADAHLGFCPNFDAAKISIESSCKSAAGNGLRGAVLEVRLGGFAPMSALYPPVACAAAAMWGSPAAEELLCEALDAFVFYDSTGDFARAVCALSRVDSSGLPERLLLAPADGLPKIAAEFAHVDLSVLRGAADFAMGLAATSKPESRDAAVLSAEFALAGVLLNASLDRLSEADAQTFEARKTAYRFAVSDFENVWAARCGLGGLWEASAKLRAARAEFFQK